MPNTSQQVIAVPNEAGPTPWGPFDGFFIPGLALFLALVTGLFLPEKLKARAAAGLSEKRGRRSAIAILGAFIAIGIAPLLLAFAKLSEVAKHGIVGRQGGQFLVVFAIAVLIYLSILNVTRRHDEDLERDLVKAQDELENSKNQSKKDLREAKEQADKEIAEAKRSEYVASQQRDFLNVVSLNFLRLVSEKRDRVLATLGDNATPTPHELLRALEPQSQVCSLVMGAHALFHHLANRFRDGSNVRAVYFTPQGNALVPFFAWDGISSDCVAADLHEKYRDMFELDGPGCLAVHVSRFKSLFLVPDVGTERLFKVFNGNRRIKSLAALPIRTNAKWANVLCIDTDCEDFFDADRLRRVLDMDHVHRQLETRLQLESSLMPFVGSGRPYRRSDNAISSRP